MIRYETVHVTVDDSTIAAGDPFAVIQPVWWSADIYHGPETYEHSVSRFSRSQRFVIAVFWYRAEVENGGHQQFYSNSTGIVWKDAREALKALDAPQLANVLQQSVERLGGSPSLDRQERQDQLAEYDGDFNDLDRLYYEEEKKVDLDARLMDFIRARPGDFYCDGDIRRVVLPSGLGKNR
jgi:hypothetical protein